MKRTCLRDTTCVNCKYNMEECTKHTSCFDCPVSNDCRCLCRQKATSEEMLTLKCKYFTKVE